MGQHDQDEKYFTIAANLVRAEMKARGVNAATLANKLAEIGVAEMSEKNLNRKLAKGSFSAAFFLQCLHALEAKSVNLSIDP